MAPSSGGSSFLACFGAVHYSLRGCADLVKNPSPEALGSQSPMSPQRLVFHLSDLLLHNYVDAVSVSIHRLSINLRLCSGNPHGSQCSPHGLTNKPSSTDFYCETLGLPFILLTVGLLNKLMVLQASARLVLVFNSDFPWHRLFQQNSLHYCSRPTR